MKNKKLYILCLLSSLVATSLYANNLGEAVNTTMSSNHNSIKTQEKINTLVGEKEILYREYKALSNELKSLNQYNIELQDIVNSQTKEKNSIENQIFQIEDTKRDILPLIKNMLLSLEEFIDNDTPFLQNERDKRVKNLKKLIKRSDISVASKYKAVVEAFEIENEYARTIETYNDILTYNNLDKNVKFLRLGRVAFYYVSEDNKECGIWDNSLKRWVELDSSYRYKLNEAIKVASNKTVPMLLSVPMFTQKGI